MFINQISPQSLQAPIFSESQPSLVTGDLIDLDTRLAEEVSDWQQVPRLRKTELPPH